MRAAPAFQVSLRRFAIWRAAVLTLYLLGAASSVGWLASREWPVGWGVIGASLVASVLLAAATLALWRTAPADLRWDGVCWHLARPGGEALPGMLTIAIDLGPWMLLRFEPANAAGRTSTVWLPAQRRGIEPQWHALRCAVHSPQPAPVDDSGSNA